MKAKDSHGFQPLCQEIGLLLRVLWVFHLWNLKFCILHIGFLCFLSGPTWSTVLSSTPLTQGTTTDCTHQQSFAIRCIQFCTQPGACPWWEFQSRREGDCELFPTVHFLSLFDFNLPWYFAPLPSGTPLSLICAVALFQLLDMCIWELVSVGDVVAFHSVTCNVSSLLLLSIPMTRRDWRPNEALWLRLSVTGNSHGLEAVNIFQLPQQKFTSYDQLWRHIHQSQEQLRRLAY